MEKFSQLYRLHCLLIITQVPYFRHFFILQPCMPVMHTKRSLWACKVLTSAHTPMLLQIHDLRPILKEPIHDILQRLPPNTLQTQRQPSNRAIMIHYYPTYTYSASPQVRSTVTASTISRKTQHDFPSTSTNSFNFKSLHLDQKLVFDYDVYRISLCRCQ